MSTRVDSIHAGSVNTQEIRPWDKPQLINKVQKKLQGSYTTPPRIAVGLNFLDIGNKEDTRVVVDGYDVTTTEFTAGLNSWHDSILYIAGMSYLELGSKLKHIQTGVFHIEEVRPWTMPTPTVQKRIEFATPFTDGPPKVVCWIRCIDVDCKSNCRILASAQSIDQKGFTATMSVWGDTIFYAGDMTWIAYPATQKGIASGDYGCTDVRSRWDTTQHVSGKASFNNAFKTTPNLVVGLSLIDFGRTGDIRIGARTSDITSSGFTWQMDSWADSVMYESRAAWIAWTDEVETPPVPANAVPSWVSGYVGHFSSPSSPQRESASVRVDDNAGTRIKDDTNTTVNNNTNTQNNNDNTSTRVNDSTSTRVNDSANTKYSDNANTRVNDNTSTRVNDSTSTRYNDSTSNRYNDSTSTRVNDTTDVRNNNSVNTRYDDSTTTRYNDQTSTRFNGSASMRDNDYGTSTRYGDRGSTRYSDLTRMSITSPTRTDRYFSSERLIPRKVGSLDRYGSSGRFESSSDRIFSSGSMGSSDRFESSSDRIVSGNIGTLDKYDSSSDRIVSGNIGSLDRLASLEERLGALGTTESSERIISSGRIGSADRAGSSDRIESYSERIVSSGGRIGSSERLKSSEIIETAGDGVTTTERITCSECV